MPKNNEIKLSMVVKKNINDKKQGDNNHADREKLLDLFPYLAIPSSLFKIGGEKEE